MCRVVGVKQQRSDFACYRPAQPAAAETGVCKRLGVVGLPDEAQKNYHQSGRGEDGLVRLTVGAGVKAETGGQMVNVPLIRSSPHHGRRLGRLPS
jgi:hypothetical protein